MTWQSLGALTPRERQWVDYAPTTQAPDSPVEGLIYRLTGLNVQTSDPDQFYALVRFKYGLGIYSRDFRHNPSEQPALVTVPIPPAITTFPFSWIPQMQLVYIKPSNRPRTISWAVQIDEFLEPDTSAIALANLSRFLY